ncbi:hypothetical protein E5F05_02960 (plasmid) [Deinococcus metallilatus]|uniref:Membrane-bound inhibitor of C-type lysozyme n=1 Tax=Deinococcus metallilatus TaxID=1211322 RepID=A0AAJ5F6L6_9DEIO|nr:MliC family protein [Deinococcus metallilatus]MBB5295637.1 membrane-bound inhibitor of C-type lysozyme [Deinococcus metallilatus]QBY06902.1 hypothetical protein E5F05_02960 [Deinococcus metallilatus]TLK32292.1 hypothetical protein FCS05_02295 [Deinococcus metallilatus]GMA14166.1 hypothetical protein GCM10025871_04970 [Deinococcus metallilatus]
MIRVTREKSRFGLPLALLTLSACAPVMQPGGQAVIPVPDNSSAGITPVPFPQPIPFPNPNPQPPVNTVNYACEGGQSVTVSYVGANVAQVTWQGTTSTLNQAQSASGVRYSNGFYTWVTKGNQGFLTQPGLTQDSIIVANNCVARPS